MARKTKKPLTDLPTEQVIKKLFPREVIEKVKKVAHEKDTPKKSRRK